MTRCMKCMSEVDDNYKICPNCNTPIGMKRTMDYHLPANTILDNRYVVGISTSENGLVIKYNGYDKRNNKRVYIYEYYPASLVHRQGNMVGCKSDTASNIFAKSLSAYLNDTEILRKNNIEGIHNITDCLIENNTCYVICDYERYVTLGKYLKRKSSLNKSTSYAVTYSLLQTIKHLNKLGVIHGNISPEHIVITENEEIKLIDFGIGSYINSTSFTIYNPNYSAPELKDNNNAITKAADVYSVAAVYYKMLTGIAPYPFEKRQNGKRLETIRGLGINIAPHTENAILNALNIDIDSRYRDAAEFLNALKFKKTTRIPDSFRGAAPEKTEMPKYVIIAAAACIVALIIIIVTLIINVSKMDISSFKISFDKAESSTEVTETTTELESESVSKTTEQTSAAQTTAALTTVAQTTAAQINKDNDEDDAESEKTTAAQSSKKNTDKSQNTKPSKKTSTTSSNSVNTTEPAAEPVVTESDENENITEATEPSQADDTPEDNQSESEPADDSSSTDTEYNNEPMSKISNSQVIQDAYEAQNK